MPSVYRLRSWIASFPSILLFLAAVALSLGSTPKPMKVPSLTAMTVTLAAPAPEPAVAPPEPAAVAEPEPPVTPPPKQVTAQMKPPPTPRPAPVRAPEVPAEPSAMPTTQIATAASEAVAAAPAAAQAVGVQSPAASSDAAYLARIRAYLETIKHYPTSKEARLQRPRGQVEVAFVLDRGGALRDARIETSSGSIILDGAGLALVRGAAYPKFPSDVYPDEPVHRFTVELDYSFG